jgi:hypothetical protein
MSPSTVELTSVRWTPRAAAIFGQTSGQAGCERVQQEFNRRRSMVLADENGRMVSRDGVRSHMAHLLF